MFRVLPSVEHTMQDKILSIIDGLIIPETIRIDYENFISEIDSNLAYQKSMMGTEVKYGDSFQLYQNSTKKFLQIKGYDIDGIK